MTRHWVIDTSAYARLAQSPDQDEWLDRISRGLVRVTTVTLLEIGFSAQSGATWHRMHEPPIARMPVDNLTPRTEQRAVEVQGLLAERGHHRAASVPDLLIAAVAEVAGSTVLHLDEGFDLIADLTGQSVERISIV